MLTLVRTGLTLGVGYLLVFSTPSPSPAVMLFAIGYIASNLGIAYLPSRWFGRVALDVVLVLVDTAAISAALLLAPHIGADIFVFYFTVVLLASISDRRWLNLGAPIITTAAYLGFLVTRLGVEGILQPAILLRLPFLLLTGAFYGFLVERVRQRERASVAARQRAQARTELLSTITHDLKQPLWLASQAATMLYAELPSALGAPRTCAAQVILNLKRMETLALNFLDLAQLEAHGLRVHPRSVALERIVQDLVELCRPALELKQLCVHLELASALPAAWIDPLQTERCLVNLLDNAIKYTPAGGVVTIAVLVDGDHLVAVVGDSGPGIAPERVATLFARFQEGTDAAGRGSTGLGLFIAHALAAAMGGKLSLDQTQAAGAWFRLHLPIAQPSDDRAASAAATVRPLLDRLSASADSYPMRPSSAAAR